MYAKIINEETKQCEVGLGTNTEFYKSIGMSEMDVEQGYDGQWYLTGYAPAKPVETMQSEVRAVRNGYLEQSDKFMIADYPISAQELELYKQYRTYLRDYTQTDGWWQANPISFEEWKGA